MIICQVRTGSIKEHVALHSLRQNVFGNRTEQFDYVSNVVLVHTVTVTRLRLKQIVSGGQFKGKTGRTPNITRSIVTCLNDHLQTAILLSLDLVRKVPVL
jgi:hypothetical protein